MKTTIGIGSATLSSLLACLVLFAQAPGQQQQPEFIKKGQQLMRDGRLEDTLALYRQNLQSSPDSLPANIGAGSVLDLMEQGEKARDYFPKAIDSADTPERKAMAQRAMAMSHAFEGNCKKSVEYEEQALDYYRTAKPTSCTNLVTTWV